MLEPAGDVVWTLVAARGVHTLAGADPAESGETSKQGGPCGDSTLVQIQFWLIGPPACHQKIADVADAHGYHHHKQRVQLVVSSSCILIGHEWFSYVLLFLG